MNAIDRMLADIARTIHQVRIKPLGDVDVVPCENFRTVMLYFHNGEELITTNSVELDCPINGATFDRHQLLAFFKAGLISAAG